MQMPITRVLVANRGEIARRVFATCRTLGLGTVAVYTDPDANAPHVAEADARVRLPKTNDYLNADAIIAAARAAGADAVHPGYGFLSENAEFAAAVQAAGLVWIGPPVDAVRAMGSKIESKKMMAAAGVPVLEELDPDTVTADQLPVLVKASSGGGGRGMRVVDQLDALPSEVATAQREAQSAFGDPTVFCERYLPSGHHVEVQVMADSHGTVWAVGERECSIQRRHQKIIEEAPAPGLRDEVRAGMSQAAIQSAQAVGYVGAGTVEFLLDEAQHFYFMEMNTRLQVEHPVTEFITGIDLVEWQLRIAQGARLPKQQHEITQHGAAMEARLYAEDPQHGYLPSVGRITHLHWPDAAPGLRLDVGVDTGDEVSPFYDPMLGKIVACGETRGEAADRLRKALHDVEIVGLTTNRALLTSVLADAEFLRGGIATNFLNVRHAHLSFGDRQAGDVDAVLAAAWCATRNTLGDALWTDSRGWRLAANPRSAWTFGERTVVVEGGAPNAYVAHLAGREYPLRVTVRGAQSMEAELAGQLQRLRVVEIGQDLHMFCGGRQVVLREARTEDALQVSAGAEEGSLLTPLPGTLVAVHVSTGQQVARGAPLVTVEAMKMEHTLTAPYDGIVARVAFGVAERVAAGAVLVELTPLEA